MKQDATIEVINETDLVTCHGTYKNSLIIKKSQLDKVLTNVALTLIKNDRLIIKTTIFYCN